MVAKSHITAWKCTVCDKKLKGVELKTFKNAPRTKIIRHDSQGKETVQYQITAMAVSCTECSNVVVCANCMNSSEHDSLHRHIPCGHGGDFKVLYPAERASDFKSLESKLYKEKLKVDGTITFGVNDKKNIYLAAASTLADTLLAHRRIIKVYIRISRTRLHYNWLRSCWPFRFSFVCCYTFSRRSRC